MNSELMQEKEISAEHHAMLLVTLVFNNYTSLFTTVAFRIKLKVISKDNALFSFGIHHASLSILEITCKRAYVNIDSHQAALRRRIINICL